MPDPVRNDRPIGRPDLRRGCAYAPLVNTPGHVQSTPDRSGTDRRRTVTRRAHAAVLDRTEAPAARPRPRCARASPPPPPSDSGTVSPAPRSPPSVDAALIAAAPARAGERRPLRARHRGVSFADDDRGRPPSPSPDVGRDRPAAVADRPEPVPSGRDPLGRRGRGAPPRVAPDPVRDRRRGARRPGDRPARRRRRDRQPLDPPRHASTRPRSRSSSPRRRRRSGSTPAIRRRA